MARFIVHLAGGGSVAVDADDPAGARVKAKRTVPGAQISKVKIDRNFHRPAHGPRRHRADSRRFWF